MEFPKELQELLDAYADFVYSRGETLAQMLAPRDKYQKALYRFVLWLNSWNIPTPWFGKISQENFKK
jgi:hypothetical protein